MRRHQQLTTTLHHNLLVSPLLLKHPYSVERHLTHLRRLLHHPRTVMLLHQARNHQLHQDQWAECLRHETLHRHQVSSHRLRRHMRRPRYSKHLQLRLLPHQRAHRKVPHEPDLLWEALLRVDHQGRILDLDLDNPMELLQQQLPSIVSNFLSNLNAIG